MGGAKPPPMVFISLPIPRSHRDCRNAFLLGALNYSPFALSLSKCILRTADPRRTRYCAASHSSSCAAATGRQNR